MNGELERLLTNLHGGRVKSTAFNENVDCGIEVVDNRKCGEKGKEGWRNRSPRQHDD